MEERNINELLWNRIVEMNDLELKRSKVLVTIFSKTSDEIINKKIESMIKCLEDQAKFYGQDIELYQNSYNEILSKYRNQLDTVINMYKKFFVNIQLELQEAQCNQKIALANYAKSFNIKQSIDGKVEEAMVEEYKTKMVACYDKNNEYDIVISECIKKMYECISSMENKMNSIFINKSAQISIKNENLINNIISKIINKFVGSKKFNTYVIEPTNIELEMIENKLPDISNQIQQEIIRFVAKTKKDKMKINEKFEKKLIISVN